MTQEEFFGDKPKTAPEGAAPPQELITITQLPIIEQQLHLLKAEVEAATADALALDCTEDTVKAIKAVRADLNKRRAPYDQAMREIEQQVMAPYAQLEAVYKDCVADPLSKADGELRDRINAVEEEIKSRKEQEVNTYFFELCAAHGIDFLCLRDTGVKVLLSGSVKSYKAQAKEFVERVMEDLEAISTHTDCAAEILVEYKHNGYNSQRAIITVRRRIDDAAAERARQEQLTGQREAEVAAEAALLAAAEEYPDPEPLAPPAPEPEPEEEKLYELSFKVHRVSRTKAVALKNFLIEGGYDYE